MPMLSVVGLVALPLAAQTTPSANPWRPAEFPISFWLSPPASERTVERFREMAECNFTFVGPCGMSDPEETRAMLDRCQEAGRPPLYVQIPYKLRVLPNELPARVDFVAHEILE